MGTCCEHVCEVFCARLKCNKLYGECPTVCLCPAAARHVQRSLKKKKSDRRGRLPFDGVFAFEKAEAPRLEIYAVSSRSDVTPPAMRESGSATRDGKQRTKLTW